MPTLLTPANVREHVDTDLLDPAIQRLLDDADGEILKRYGPHAGAVTEVIDGRSGVISVSRRISAITSVTEREGTTDTVLAANDYETWYGKVLARLTTGTNPSDEWAGRVTVIYTPEDEAAMRRRVELDLVKLAIEYDAIRSESAGDYARTLPEYQQERDAILANLQPALGVA